MRTVFLSLFAVILLISSAHSQGSEDALRLALQGPGFSARSLSLGMAYTGIASDYSAVYSNPAGLGQIKRNEISLGLSHFSYGNTSTFMGNSTSFTNSTTDLNDLGLVYSFPTTQGSLVLAFGYGRTPIFNSGLSFKGNNPYSSMVPSLDQTLAYELYLIDSHNETLIEDSVRQEGRVLENGGINNWLISGAVETAENLFLGVTLNFVSGSYEYTRNYAEYDSYDKYTFSRFDTNYAFDHLNLLQKIDGSISGFTARLGLLYKFNSHSRIGFNIKLPTSHTIEETYSADGKSVFDVPDRNGYTEYTYGYAGTTKYGVTTPFNFTAGFSVGGDGVMLASDVQYTDWTQLQFTDIEGDPTLDQYNSDFKEIFTSTFNFHVGAEVHIPQTTLRLRGGFAYLPSPYKADQSNNDQKFITGGLGVLVADALMIDVAFAHGFWETSHVNYDLNPNFYNSDTPLSETQEKISTNNVMATLSYRF